MAKQYGLTSLGFSGKQQQEIIAEMNAGLQAVFGANINLGPESVFGQLVGIFSEREALVWQLAEAVYNSQYPSGAEGSSVDNILALNNLRRLEATATITNGEPEVQDTEISLYGLVLYGTAGTVVPAGSQVKNTASPPLTFETLAPVTIAAAVDAVQTLFMSNLPDSGAFSLSIEAPSGSVLTTESISYECQDQVASISWPSAPTSGSFYIALGGYTTGAIPFTANAAAVEAEIQALAPYAAVTVTGSFAAGFEIDFGAIPHPIVQTNSTIITFSAVPAVGAYTLALNGDPTASLPFDADNEDVQAAIRALTGFEQVFVTGDTTDGFLINWGYETPATVTVPANTTLTTITPASSYTLDQSSTVLQTVQSFINNLYDSEESEYPYTDVSVEQISASFILTFGVNTPLSGEPSSGDQPQAKILISANTLMNGITVTNLAVVNTTHGAPAQGIGQARCTETGPNFVGANTLTVIGTPVSGWASVTNQLDCITGTDEETDTEALQRRTALLAAQANGPLQAIVQKVRAVSGVTACIGFQNLNGAALQRLSFASVPVAGTWYLKINDDTTPAIDFDATSAEVQTAIQTLPGFSGVTVTGSVEFDFVIDFNGALGGQAIDLFEVVNNTTGVTITPSFDRPPKSFEIVVSGGDDMEIAEVIYNSMPAGILSYGSTTVQVLDIFSNLVNISFSRPEQIQIYVSISLITDTYNTPGDSGSGINPQAKFNPQSVNDIQSQIIAIGNAVPIGGLIVGFGTNGLIGAFNDVPGIVSYDLFFGLSPNPTLNDNIQMLSEQVPVFESFNVVVSFE